MADEDERFLHSHLVTDHSLPQNTESGRPSATQTLSHWVRHLTQDEASQSANGIQSCISACEPEKLSIGLRRLKLLQDVCVTYSLFPESLRIIGVQRGRRFAAAGDATIYQGIYEDAPVLIRENHPPTGGDWTSEEGKKIVKLIYQDFASLWQLQHSNIAMFKGLYYPDGEEDGPPAMVVRREKHTSVFVYLREHTSTRNTLQIIQGISDGLRYLHSRVPPIIHGDLHPDAVMVNEDGEAVLYGAGLSGIRHEITKDHEARSNERLRYLAPELGLGFRGLIPTTYSDIYSLAMTIYALGTLNPPYKGTSAWGAAQIAVEGQRPEMPDGFARLDHSDAVKLWSIITRMWVQTPSDRPPIPDVYQDLAVLVRDPIAESPTLEELADGNQMSENNIVDAPAPYVDAEPNSMSAPLDTPSISIMPHVHRDTETRAPLRALLDFVRAAFPGSLAALMGSNPKSEMSDASNSSDSREIAGEAGPRGTVTSGGALADMPSSNTTARSHSSSPYRAIVAVGQEAVTPDQSALHMQRYSTLGPELQEDIPSGTRGGDSHGEKTILRRVTSWVEWFRLPFGKGKEQN